MSPSRTSPIPAPRPLSTRAAAYVRQLFEETTARQAAIEKAVLAATAPARPVAKAKPKSDQVACYDANGNLVGVVDPDAITMVAAAKAPAAQRQTGDDELGGPKPAPQAGAPVQPVQGATEPEEVTKARRGDFRGAGRILKARLDASHDAREQADAANGLQAVALAELARMRATGRAV